MAVCVTTMPAAHADLCDFQLQFGRIDVVLYTRSEDTDVIDDATDAAEWALRVSNSAALTSSGTAAPIRYHYVTGEWPDAELSEVEVSNGRKAYSTPKHTINLEIDDVGATNSALLATEQGVTKQRRVWFIANGQLHGGESGYLMSVTYLTKKIPGSRNDLQKIGLRCYYEGKQTAPITSVVPV